MCTRFAVIQALVLWMGFGALTWTQVPAAAPDDPLVQRFLSRHDDPLTQYRGTRRLEAYNGRFKKEAWLLVETELDLERGFTYRIIDQGGSEYILKRVLRPFLENEAGLTTARDSARDASSVSTENYRLQAGATTEPGVTKLLITPRRRHLLLVDGAAFLDDAADLLRIEGKLSKNPSFWTKRVDVVRYYGRVGGVRVPVRFESTAQIRMAGMSKMTMTYDYLMVNGVPVATESASAYGRPVPARTVSARP